MQDCNVLSLICRIAGSGLFALSLLMSAPVQAQTDSPFSVFSRFIPALGESGIATPTDELTVHEIVTALQPPNSIDLTASPDNLWDRLRNGFAMPTSN